MDETTPFLFVENFFSKFLSRKLVPPTDRECVKARQTRPSQRQSCGGARLAPARGREDRDTAFRNRDDVSATYLKPIN